MNLGRAVDKKRSKAMPTHCLLKISKSRTCSFFFPMASSGLYGIVAKLSMERLDDFELRRAAFPSECMTFDESVSHDFMLKPGICGIESL